jgi:LacI family transcriptional regulator
VLTSSDIAREAGVSQTTVSRVLNDDPRVTKETRQRVIDVIDRHGYTPNAIARGLVTSRTSLVGVLISDIMNPFYPELLEAIGSQLAAYGLRMLVADTASQPEEVHARLLVEHRVDGIVFTSALLDSQTVASLAARRFPIVLANRYVDGVECDTVTTDNGGGAKAVAEHLLELGHERIAVVTGNEKSSTSRDRYAGFVAVLEEAGVGLDPTLVRTGDYDYERAHATTVELLELTPPPTAIFCLNDVMAFATLNACRRLRVGVPEEVSVVGFDDIRASSYEAYELTTVRQPLGELARTAVDLLAERVAAPDVPPRSLVFPSRLIRRKTTAPPRRAIRRRTVAQADGRRANG